MATSEELRKQSRLIRKLAKEGKTIEEIATTCNLTKNQVRYRINTKYSTTIANGILQQLQENKQQKQKEKFSKKQSTINKEPVGIVVDACVLRHANIFSVLERYSKVILITDVIRELDKLKTENTLVGRNAREILKRCAQDIHANKYQVEVANQISNYTDENLIEYCKDKNVILYTSDHALASLAKGYGIPYLLGMQEEEQEKQASQTIVKNQKEIPLEPSDRIHNLDNIHYVEGNLKLYIPDTNRINYIVLSQNKMILPDANRQIDLKLGDIIFILTYKLKHKGLCISMYQIYDIKEQGYSIFLGAHKVNSMQRIHELKVPIMVKKKIIDYFLVVSK